MKKGSIENTKEILRCIKKLNSSEIELLDFLSQKKKQEENENKELSKKVKRLWKLYLMFIPLSVIVGIISELYIDIGQGIAFGGCVAIGFHTLLVPLTFKADKIKKKKKQKENDESTENESIENSIKKVRESSLNLSSALLKVCNDEETISKVYDSLIDKRNNAIENKEDLTLINSVIEKYENKLNELKKERNYLGLKPEEIKRVNAVIKGRNLRDINMLDEIENALNEVEQEELREKEEYAKMYNEVELEETEKIFEEEYVEGFSDDLSEGNVLARRRTLY